MRTTIVTTSELSIRNSKIEGFRRGMEDVMDVGERKENGIKE